jgi:hypothetical protein
MVRGVRILQYICTKVKLILVYKKALYSFFQVRRVNEDFTRSQKLLSLQRWIPSSTEFIPIAGKTVPNV